MVPLHNIGIKHRLDYMEGDLQWTGLECPVAKPDDCIATLDRSRTVEVMQSGQAVLADLSTSSTRTRTRTLYYTLCPGKGSHLMFHNNLHVTLAMWTDFQIFFTNLILEKIFYIHTTKISSLRAICCYIPCETRKSTNFTKFSRWMWQLICLTNIYCEILRNLPQKYCT